MEKERQKQQNSRVGRTGLRGKHKNRHAGQDKKCVLKCCGKFPGITASEHAVERIDCDGDKRIENHKKKNVNTVRSI